MPCLGQAYCETTLRVVLYTVQDPMRKHARGSQETFPTCAQQASSSNPTRFGRLLCWHACLSARCSQSVMVRSAGIHDRTFARCDHQIRVRSRRARGIQLEQQSVTWLISYGIHIQQQRLQSKLKHLLEWLQHRQISLIQIL